jgi:polyhydroxyalkanoate synthesis regulator phasin
MMQCIEKGNWEYFDTYVEALCEEGVEDSEIKDKISKKYCSQWKDSYRKYLETEDKKYDNQMKEIEELLDNTGFKFNIYGKNGWKVNVDKEY